MKNTTKTLLMGSILTAVSLLSFTNASNHDYGDDHGENREQIMIAIEANDYTQLSEEAQERISPEDFAEKVDNYQEQQAQRAKIESAVAAGDYEAFKTVVEAQQEEKEEAREEKKEEREENFEEKHEAMKAQREEFCAGDDLVYETEKGEKEMDAEDKEEFCSDAWEQEHAEKMGNRDEDRGEKEELSDEEKEEKMQERFEELQAYYNENGMLPEKEDMMKDGKKGMMKEHMGEKKEKATGMNERYADASDEDRAEMKDDMKKTMKKKGKKARKYFKEAHGEMVRGVAKKAKKEKIQKAITKIDTMLPAMTDEKIVDILGGIRDVLSELVA